MAAKGVLRTLEGNCLGFHCPGCKCLHQVSVAPASPAWEFNGDFEKPTFSPSILVRGLRLITDENGDWTGEYERDAAGEPLPSICHSFVRAGQIQFLGDCTHALAGQTVPLKAREP